LAQKPSPAESVPDLGEILVDWPTPKTRIGISEKPNKLILIEQIDPVGWGDPLGHVPLRPIFFVAPTLRPREISRICTTAQSRH
jgi:hypothetical protein